MNQIEKIHLIVFVKMDILKTLLWETVMSAIHNVRCVMVKRKTAQAAKKDLTEIILLSAFVKMAILKIKLMAIV
jgi:hypothetical protein